MAYFRGTIRSQILDMDTLVNVVLPYDYPQAEPERTYKTLYLLHGNKQNADAWMRFSEAERLANELGFVLIMPEVQRSFYTDMKFGLRYFSYVTEELPIVMNKMFRIPQERERTFVGGLSMGGFGAMKCVLNRPDLYAGALCFSSAFYRLDEPEKMTHIRLCEMQSMIGLDFAIEKENDLNAMMDRYPNHIKKPILYIACGTEDFLYEHNQRMCRELEFRHFPYRYEEWEGIHNWKFWNVALQKGMRFLCEQ